MANTDKLADYSLKDTTGNTYFLPLNQMQFGRLYIKNRFVTIACHQNKTTHLRLGNYNRTAMLTIHNKTYRHRRFEFIFQNIYTLTGGVNKNEIVNSRKQFTDAFPRFHDIFIAHRNEVLNILGIQNCFQR